MSILVALRPTFQRAMRVVSTITNSFPVVITTTTNHQYITGMIVRLNIPKHFGMQQANQLYSEIIVTGNTTFTMDIDTTQMDPFLSLINLGTTDSSGNISGTVSTNLIPLGIGQSFSIGEDIFLIISSSGAMYTNGTGSGTFDISTGAYVITGSEASTVVYFSSVPYPYSYQYTQVTPIGENNDTLQAATRNVLGTGFYN